MSDGAASLWHARRLVAISGDMLRKASKTDQALRHGAFEA